MCDTILSQKVDTHGILDDILSHDIESLSIQGSAEEKKNANLELIEDDLQHLCLENLTLSSTKTNFEEDHQVTENEGIGGSVSDKETSNDENNERNNIESNHKLRIGVWNNDRGGVEISENVKHGERHSFGSNQSYNDTSRGKSTESNHEVENISSKQVHERNNHSTNGIYRQDEQQISQETNNLNLSVKLHSTSEFNELHRDSEPKATIISQEKEYNSESNSSGRPNNDIKDEIRTHSLSDSPSFLNANSILQDKRDKSKIDLLSAGCDRTSSKRKPLQHNRSNSVSFFQEGGSRHEILASDESDRSKNAPFKATLESIEIFCNKYPPQYLKHSSSFHSSVNVQSNHKCNKLITRYRFIPQANAKDTIVCIHGLLSNMNFWNILCCHLLAAEENEKLTEEYSDHSNEAKSSGLVRDTSYYDFIDEKTSYNILLYDNFNSGESSKIPQPVPQVFVRQLLELLQHLKQIEEYDVTTPPKRSLVLIGHSQGGSIALHFANQFSDLVEKLVLCAPGGFLKTTPSLARYARTPFISKLLFSVLKVAFSYDKIIERGFFGTQNKELLLKYMRANRVDSLVHALRSTLKYFPLQGSEYLIDWLSNYQKAMLLKLDVLICWGVYDHDAPCSILFPVIEEKLRYMNTSFVLFDNTRHTFPFERGDDFAKVVLNFLDGGSLVSIKDVGEYKPDVKLKKKDVRARAFLSKKYASCIV